jgi:hypothetical protein
MNPQVEKASLLVLAKALPGVDCRFMRRNSGSMLDNQGPSRCHPRSLPWTVAARRDVSPPSTVPEFGVSSILVATLALTVALLFRRRRSSFSKT